MKVKVTTITGENKGDISLNDAVFGIEARQDILHRVVTWQLSKKQQGTHHTKSRGDINATGKKPFRQKGTGNARQGDLKGPHMRKGAVAHGPKTRSHALSLPKKVRSLGLKMALSQKIVEKNLRVIENTKVSSKKTKDLSESLKKQGLSNVLVIDDSFNDSFIKLSNNLADIDILPVGGANVYDLIDHENVFITKDAISKLEERLA